MTKFNATVKITNGNAYAIMGAVSKAIKKAGATQEEIKKYQEESVSGDYNNVITTASKYVNVEV